MEGQNLIPIAYPPPYRGQRDDLPLSVLQSPHCARVCNYNLDTGEAELRNGDSVYVNPGTGFEIALNVATYGEGSGQEMFICADPSAGGITWYDVSTSTPSTAHSVASGGDDEIHTLFFNDYLFYFGENNLKPSSHGPQYYNGSAWGAAGYTYPAGITTPFGGTAFRNRAYIIEKDSSKYMYSGINAISGALTEVDLAQVITEKGFLYGIRPIPVTVNAENSSALAFVMNTGEVLVYTGSYPNSANWRQVGRFQIGKPVYYNAFVDTRGDSFVITENGLISLRSLFSQGEDLAEQQALSASMPNRWQQIMTSLFSGFEIYIKGAYDKKRDRIVITIPQWVDPDDGTLDPDFGLRLVYSFKTQSWFEHKFGRNNFTGNPAFYKGDMYIGTDYRGALKMEGASGFVDEATDGTNDEPVQYHLRTTPLPTEKFGVNMIQGIELIMQTDLYAETNFKLIGNFGKSETASQTIPDQGASVEVPLLNVGILSNYVQLDISGTATADATVGQIIKAFNIWVEKGGLR